MSPRKSLLTPTKNVDLPKNASPQRRLLFSPKENSGSPVKTSPTKLAAYQRYQSLAEGGTPALTLPYNYRLLAETFRCVDTVFTLPDRIFDRNCFQRHVTLILFFPGGVAAVQQKGSDYFQEAKTRRAGNAQA